MHTAVPGTWYDITSRLRYSSTRTILLYAVRGEWGCKAATVPGAAAAAAVLVVYTEVIALRSPQPEPDNLTQRRQLSSHDSFHNPGKLMHSKLVHGTNHTRDRENLVRTVQLGECP